MNILIIGNYIRQLVESAYKSGFNVFSISYFNDLDLHRYSVRCISYLKNVIDTKPLIYERDSVKKFFENSLKDFLEKYDINIVVPKINEEYIEGICNKYGVKVIGNDYKILRKISDKLYVYKICNDLNINVPEYFLRENDIEEYLKRGIKFLVKPRYGSGGYFIRFYNQYDKLSKDFFLQRYIDGNSFNITVYSNGSEIKLLYVSKQLVGLKEFGAEYFKYCGSLGFYYTKHYKKAFYYLKKLIEYFNLKGILGADFVEKYGNVFLVDFNPRIQSSFECIEISYKKYLFKKYMDAFEGKPIEKFYIKRNCAKVILYAKNSCRISKDFSGIAKDVPNIGTRVLKEEPILTLIKSGRNYTTCFNKLKKKALKIYSFLNKSS